MRVREARIARNSLKRVGIASWISGRFGMCIYEEAVIVGRCEGLEVVPIMVVHRPFDGSTGHLQLLHPAGSLAVATRRGGRSRERRWHIDPRHLHIAIEGEGSQRVDGDFYVLRRPGRVLRSYYDCQSFCRAWKDGDVTHVSSGDNLIALAALIHRWSRGNQIADCEEAAVGAAGRYGDHPSVRGRLDTVKAKMPLRVGAHRPQDRGIAESALQPHNHFPSYRRAGHGIDHGSRNGTRRAAPGS